MYDNEFKIIKNKFWTKDKIDQFRYKIQIWRRWLGWEKNERNHLRAQQWMIRSSLVSIRQTDIFLSAVALKDILHFLHEISLSLEISVHKSLSLFNF